MTVTIEHIAAGGNSHPSAADWSTSLLAFGAGNNIALWNPDDARQAGISALLAGHSDAVNAVKIYDDGQKRIIVSGSADKTIRLWSASHESASGFEETASLADHTASVNALAILPQKSMFASGSADATVKIWDLFDSKPELVQSIPLKPRFYPLALALASLSNGDTVLAVAGTTNIVQVYVRANTSTEFEIQATLSGHESWIRSLDFTNESSSPDSDVLLASASQDRYVRLWRFRQDLQKATAEQQTGADLAIASSIKSLSNKAHQVGSSRKYSITFEALLIGHEDWIYTVRWAPRSNGEKIPALMSASADNSLAMWEPDAASGLWVCSSRLGEISSQKGSTTATGSTGGFWIGLWHPEGRSVASLGRTGSWRKWTFDSSKDMWTQRVGTSGHVQEVQGVAWAPDGSYLLSTGSDQTTRLLAEWRRNEVSSWHEMSRPQIHGYDLNCISHVTKNRFISGADEKLLRVFNKPKAVDLLLSKLSGTSISLADELPEAANIPVLGLSNKATVAIDDGENLKDVSNGDVHEQHRVDPASATHTSTLDLDQPPLEEHLARYTLWPEHEKLYGHGYEICAVTTNHDGSLVATACKASSMDHAVIRIYETREWREVKPPLTAHSLTVTSLSFSPDDRFLLSVGRDRQWTVFERSVQDANLFSLHTSNPKGHSRMILDCAWAPTAVGHVFATAGRDKTIKLWNLSEGKAECRATVATNAAVTAVAFKPEVNDSHILLAHGNEAGAISLVTLNTQTFEVRDTKDIDRMIAPSKTVNSLRWRTANNAASAQLAVASDDGSVRICNIS